jgi:hypothetical protein
MACPTARSSGFTKFSGTLYDRCWLLLVAELYGALQERALHAAGAVPRARGPALCAIVIFSRGPGTEVDYMLAAPVRNSYTYYIFSQPNGGYTFDGLNPFPRINCMMASILFVT